MLLGLASVKGREQSPAECVSPASRKMWLLKRIWTKYIEVVAGVYMQKNKIRENEVENLGKFRTLG